jgi:hypothetical protein
MASLRFAVPIEIVDAFLEGTPTVGKCTRHLSRSSIANRAETL